MACLRGFLRRHSKRVRVTSGLLIELQQSLPMRFEELKLNSARERGVGLVIVDVVNGFCTVGAGNLAPKVFDEQISSMVAETNRVAKLFSERGLPILALLDCHERHRPEPPYPEHCVVGTGEENLVPEVLNNDSEQFEEVWVSIQLVAWLEELAWLESDSHAQLMRKDCVDGFVGAIRKDGRNAVANWIKFHQIETVVVVGICTDVCVLDFVSTILSARNHGMLEPLLHVVVYSEACATVSTPRLLAAQSPAGRQEIMHYVGLYMAADRGAVVARTLTFKDHEGT